MDYISCEMPEGWDFNIVGSNEAIIANNSGDKYQVTCSGNGDSFNHIAHFSKIS